MAAVMFCPDLDSLDDSALDRLPFGVVALDEQMQVVRMNRAESDARGIQRWRAIGRDFFGDVAPGPTNRALADQIRAFRSGEGPRAISHVFRRRTGTDPTTIELVQGRDAAVYLCIRRPEH